MTTPTTQSAFTSDELDTLSYPARVMASHDATLEVGYSYARPYYLEPFRAILAAYAWRVTVRRLPADTLAGHIARTAYAATRSEAEQAVRELRFMMRDDDPQPAHHHITRVCYHALRRLYHPDPWDFGYNRPDAY